MHRDIQSNVDIEKITPLLVELQSSLEGRLNLDILAERYGYSRYHFHRWFTKTACFDCLRVSRGTRRSDFDKVADGTRFEPHRSSFESPEEKNLLERQTRWRRTKQRLRRLILATSSGR
jgi:hypothetical protein